MYQKSRDSWVKYIDFMVIDFLCMNLAYILAFHVRFSDRGFVYLVSGYRILIAVICIIQFLFSIVLNNFADVLKRGWNKELGKILILALATLAGTTLYMYSAHNADFYSRLLLYYTIGFYVILGYFSRIAWKPFRKFLVKKYIFTKSARSVLLISDINSVENLIHDVKNDMLHSLFIKGIVLTGEYDKELSEIMGIPVVASIEKAANYVCTEWIDEIFINPESMMYCTAFISKCKEMGVTVHMILELQNIDSHKQFVEELGGRTVLSTVFNYMTPFQVFVKRCMDILGGIIGCVLTVLIGIIIGPLIYLNSPGPIFFRQLRVGKNGRHFRLIKFRSMYLDAEERKKEFLSQNRIADGRMFKLDYDPRIIGNRILPDGTKKTGIGEFIRKTSLDEFPQFFNILKGDMSLVGTRPPTIDEWEKYEYHHRARLAIKPGLTGLWQVSGRSEITDFEEVVLLDTKYIMDYRLSLDLIILFKTLGVIFKHKGAM